MNKKEPKLIITGTGRAGTTALLEVLTELGLDTGLNNPETPQFHKSSTTYFETCHAGLEFSPLKVEGKTPYVIKDPDFCGQIHELYERFTIQGVLIPIRGLQVAALSRLRIYKQYGEGAAGGLWNVPSDEVWGDYRDETQKLSQQTLALAVSFYELVFSCVQLQIPFVFLEYPRFLKNPYYLYKQLCQIIGLQTEIGSLLKGDHPVARVSWALKKVVKPELLP